MTDSFLSTSQISKKYEPQKKKKLGIFYFLTTLRVASITITVLITIIPIQNHRLNDSHRRLVSFRAETKVVGITSSSHSGISKDSVVSVVPVASFLPPYNRNAPKNYNR